MDASRRPEFPRSPAERIPAPRAGWRRGLGAEERGREGAAGPRALARIRVILVEPTGPLNVGSTARAMANFGLSDLCVVGGPRLDHPQALEMSVSGKPILQAATRVATLEEACADLSFLVGTTARSRHRVSTLRADEAAPLVIEEAGRGRVGLVFGREDHGLSSDELRRMHRVIAIETAPECRALNLAQAVLLIAYEIFRASEAPGLLAHSAEGPLLRHEQVTRLLAGFRQALDVLGIRKPSSRVAIDQTLERLLALGPMQTRDARILFAMVRRVIALEGEAASDDLLLEPDGTEEPDATD